VTLIPTWRLQEHLHIFTDYTLLLDLPLVTAPQVTQYRRSLRDLQPRIEAAQKQETGEMVEKLKGLGDSILGTRVQTWY
jgi:hypothetical protein